MKRAREPSAAGREDAGEHAAPCYHQPHLGRSPARGPAPARRVSAGPAGPTLSRAVLQLGPSASDPTSAVARVLLSEWPYRGPRGSPGRPQPSSAVRLLFGTFSGSVRSWAPLLPARVLGACHSVPSAIRLTFTSVPVALSPWNCPPPNLPSTSLSLSNTHTQSFDLDAPTVTHTDPLSHRLNTDDKVPHSLSASPLSEERLLLATSRGSAIKVSGVSQGSGHPWTAGQCRVQDPKPGSASGTLWITLVKQGIRNL